MVQPAAGDELVAIPGLVGEHRPIVGRHDVRIGLSPLAVVAIDPQCLPLVEIVFEHVEPRRASIIHVEIDDAADRVLVSRRDDARKHGVPHAINREAGGRAVDRRNSRPTTACQTSGNINVP